MDIYEKLTLLGASAKYDVSCASSGSSRKGALGATLPAGICHSWTGDGRCISLLKILMSNRCMYRCAYCANNALQDIPRASFSPAEVADLTEAFYKRNYIEGLFLSSGVWKSPDFTMEQMLEAARLLRERGFGGYIHLKTIPGASAALIETAGRLADRVSVNIELPSEQSLTTLAPEKTAASILQPMGYTAGRITESLDEQKRFRKAPLFVPSGQSTQLIVGASPENDLSILKLTQALYRRYSLKRVYFSAFIPTTRSPLLPNPALPPLNREHRLYQADWLLRFYGFAAEELVSDQFPQLDEELDPKSAWALRNPAFFPVEVNTASLENLLRVPGIGQVSARRLLTARRYGGLTMADVQKAGVVMKRAAPFILCRGRFDPSTKLNGEDLRLRLLSGEKHFDYGRQLTFADIRPSDPYAQLGVPS